MNGYDAYGIPNETNIGRFQYTGQIWLAELGLYYYKARIYSPTLGRFLQTDPIGYEDQYNLYAYVGNDPVNGVDPNGLCGVGQENVVDGCSIVYGPRNATGPSVNNINEMQHHFIEGDGSLMLFNVENYNLGKESSHGQTVANAVNGRTDGSSLFHATRASALTGETVPVNFRTIETSISGVGNYTIKWSGTLSATSSNYEITATGTIADSQFNWDQDSGGSNLVRDIGTALVRAAGGNEGTSYTLRGDRNIEGYFSGYIEKPIRE